MPFAAALSTHPDAATATAEVTGQVVDRLGASPDLAVVFLSGSHVEAADETAATIGSLLDPRAFVGASACGVLGGPRGVEEVAAVSLWDNAGELKSATSMQVAAIDDPCKRIGLLYEPVDAFACVVRTAGARIMNGSEAPCK